MHKMKCLMNVYLVVAKRLVYNMELFSESYLDGGYFCHFLWLILDPKLFLMFSRLEAHGVFDISFGSIDSLEYDAPIISIVWVIWTINEKLGSVYFKVSDLKNNI